MLELIGVLETAPELVAELSLGSYTSVLPITTATVGQVIVVKATDENGRPTEFEAVDIEDIANVADEVDALAALSECSIVTPAYQDGTFYTDADGAIYVL